MAHVTIPDENAEILYSSQTGTGPFTFDFEWFQKADLNIYIGGATSPLAVSAFSVTPTTTLTGGFEGGSITLNDAVSAQDVFIQRRTKPGREGDFAVGGATPQSVNTALDLLQAFIVDAKRDLSRCLRQKPFDTSDPLYVGTVAERSFKVLAFKADGTIEFVDRADIDAIASIVNEIANLGTADAISDINALTTGDNLTNIATVAPAVDNIQLLGTAAVIADLALLADAGVIADMDALADLTTELANLGASDVAEDITILASATNISRMATLAGIETDITAVAAVAGSVATVAADIDLGASSTILTALTNATNAANSATQAFNDAVLIGPFAVRNSRYFSPDDDGAPADMADLTDPLIGTDGGQHALIGPSYSDTQISPKAVQRYLPSRVYRIQSDVLTASDGSGTPNFQVQWVLLDQDFNELTTVNETVTELAVADGRTQHSWRASTPGISPAEDSELDNASCVWIRARLVANASGGTANFRVYGFWLEDITTIRDAEDAQLFNADEVALPSGVTALSRFSSDTHADDALTTIDTDLTALESDVAAAQSDIATAETNITTLFGLGLADYDTISAAVAAGSSLEEKILIKGKAGGIYYQDSSDLSSVMVVNTQTTTSVDAGTDTFTLANHGYRTGDGVTPTASLNGLTAGAPYWVRRTNTNQFTLHATLADAWANTNKMNLVGAVNTEFKLLLDSVGAVYLVPSNLNADGSEGAWVRVYQEGEVLAWWFGAEGDGATDDTIPLNAMSRFTNAWADKNSDAGCVGVFPPGEFLTALGLNKHLDAVSGWRFRGFGMDTSTLVLTNHTEDLIAFMGEKDKNTPFFGMGVENITLCCSASDVSNAGADAGALLRFYHVNGVRAYNVEFRGGYRGLYCTRIANPAFFGEIYFNNGARVTGGWSGIEFDSDSATGRVNTTVHLGRVEAGLGEIAKYLPTSVTSNVFSLTGHGLTTGWSIRVYDDYDVLSENDEFFVRAVTADTFTLHPTKADAVANTNVQAVANGTPGRFIRPSLQHGVLIKAMDGIYGGEKVHFQGTNIAFDVAPDNTASNDRIYTIRLLLYCDNGGLHGLRVGGQATDGIRILDFNGGEIQDVKYGIVFESTTAVTATSLNFDEVRNCDRWAIEYRDANSEDHTIGDIRFRFNNADDDADGGEIKLNGDGHTVNCLGQVRAATTSGNVIKIESAATDVDVVMPRATGAGRTSTLSQGATWSEIKRLIVDQGFDYRRPQEATLSSGAFTATQEHVEITAESGSSDTLDTINGVPVGAPVVLRANPGNTITVESDTGNIRLNNSQDFELNTIRDAIALEYRADNYFYELWRNSGTVQTPTATTISSGSVTLTPSPSNPLPGYELQSQGGAGVSDDLDTISGLTVGTVVKLRAAGGHTIVVKDGTGNIRLVGSADYTMANLRACILLELRADNFLYEVSRG